MKGTWFLLFCGGCTGEPVVLAVLPDGGDREGVRCTDESDCHGDRFCETPTCHDVAGTCRSYPHGCDGPEEPVCGCDGRSYPSSCARRAAGIASESPGPCASEK